MSEALGYPQLFVAMGGTSLLSGFLAWATGRRTALANARKTNAEAAKLESDTRIEAVRVEASRVDFEKALNERATMVMGSLENQVKYLAHLVESQTVKLNEQSILMTKMEIEIRDLHKALEVKTQHLHKVLALLPSVKALYDDSGNLDVSLITHQGS